MGSRKWGWGASRRCKRDKEFGQEGATSIRGRVSGKRLVIGDPCVAEEP